MLAGEGAGKRDDGSCWIKHGSRPGEDGQSCDALGHFHSKNLWDRNRNSHQHRRQLLRCWNFHRVHHNHIHWSCLLQVLRNLWHLNTTFQGSGTSQQGCKRIIPRCNCDQIQRKQCWHLNNPTVQSKILDFLFFTTTAIQVEPQGRSDVEAFLEMDGILGKTMQSGSMTWSEMQMMSPMKPACGRSGKERRPRYERRDLER